MRINSEQWTQIGGDAPTTVLLQVIAGGVMVHLGATDPGAAKSPYADGEDEIEAFVINDNAIHTLEPGGLNVWVRPNRGAGHIAVFAS